MAFVIWNWYHTFVAIGNESLRTAKAQLRTEAKEALGRIIQADRHRLSTMIHRRLLSLPAWAQSDEVLLFDSMPDEVNTGPLITAADREGKRIYLPRMHGSDIYFHLFAAADLEPHSYGMMEPPADAPMWSPAAADATGRQTVIICPGLAFDDHGRRLGRGKGFYDRFLSGLAGAPQWNPTVAVIAICFEIQVVDEVPTGPHDLRVDAIVTEERTVRAGPR